MELTLLELVSFHIFCLRKRAEVMMKRKLDQGLRHIKNLLECNLLDEAYTEYLLLEEIIESKTTIITTDGFSNVDFYVAFAHFLLSISEYEEFLKRFIKAQDLGYSKIEIRKVLWEGFIEPNLQEFKSIYEHNMEFLISNGYILKAVNFDDLPFWLITTGVHNEYYIYDKNEENIKGKFCLDNNKSLPLAIPENFADCLILEKWDLSNILPYINYIKNNNRIKNENRKCYIIVKDMRNFLSYFQADSLSKDYLSNVLIFDGFINMKEYFKNCSEYLPRNIFDFMNETEQAQTIINEIHEYRISKEGRTGDNILLSVCIPSYNRGKTAYDNIIYSLQCYYDEEIEFILSNNGSENISTPYYDKISEIVDSRLNYFAFEENRGVAINICKVCELAKGKFILFLSDEDVVYFNVLHKIMNLLRNSKLSILRTKGNKQGIIPSTKFAKPGRDALLTYMLTSNYMSGIIFNNSLLKQHNAIKYIKENLDNSVCLNYPHMFWELLLCQYGNVKGTDIILINEGEERESYAPRIEVGGKHNILIPYYASIEGRLEQHEGFLNIFKELEICLKNFTVFREMYLKLCSKTLFLVNLSINVFYENTDLELLEILNKAYAVCIKYLDVIYQDRPESDKVCHVADLEQIRNIYYSFRNRL